jgi:hypothetical protein
MTYDKDDLHYISGFDHGCDYIVNEIERYMRAQAGTEAVLAPLLRHLRMEDVALGKLLTKKVEPTA